MKRYYAYPGETVEIHGLPGRFATNGSAELSSFRVTRDVVHVDPRHAATWSFRASDDALDLPSVVAGW